MFTRALDRSVYWIRKTIAGPYAQNERHFERLRHGITKQSRILEIGPSVNPIVPKKDGWQVYTVDNASREQLVERYRSHKGIDVSKIEEVNFVWTGGLLTKVIPDSLHGTFDVAIASHVIEHIPDLLGFFQSISMLLKPGGVLHLAVPDKRYCFDWFRPHSTTGQILQAYKERRDRPSVAMQYDQVAYECVEDGAIAWTQKPLGRINFINTSFSSAYARFNSAISSPEYHDCHCWQFVPASFDLLLLELRSLGMTDLLVEKIFSADGCEFIVHLRKSDSPDKSEAEINALRLEKLHQIVEQLGEQADYQRRAVGKRRYSRPYTH